MNIETQQEKKQRLERVLEKATFAERATIEAMQTIPVENAYQRAVMDGTLDAYVKELEDLMNRGFGIGARSDFNRTGYGVYTRIDKNRTAWVGDVYETREQAYQAVLEYQRYRENFGKDVQ